MGFTMTQAEIDKHQARVHGKNHYNRSRGVANVEQSADNEPQGSNEVENTLPPVVIRFTHYRRKLADVDNFATKHYVDSLVKNGILRDDSPEEVSEVSHRQIKVEQWEEERTVIELVGAES